MLHAKADDVLLSLSWDSAIRQDLSALAKCPYEVGALSEPLSHIQAELIDEMDLAGYRNLEARVAELDKEVEVLLVSRLRAAIESWVTTSNAQADGGGGGVPGQRMDSGRQASKRSSPGAALLERAKDRRTPPPVQPRASSQ
jgi:hypothetical protein